ncbi:MAG TPA: winged helix-turn-helix domain-containing protein [Candidatus Acidoferrales bacterium]|nr:winged helix-turn-helix domain-containing protein [Candidatus Acidoferrales bacterium]
MIVLEVKTIGETAGLVWNFLRSNGDASLTALEKGIEAPKTMVSMAVGWLAREGKIDLRDEKRAVRVSLKDSN